jgi:hypothetical protein
LKRFGAIRGDGTAIAMEMRNGPVEAGPFPRLVARPGPLYVFGDIRVLASSAGIGGPSAPLGPSSPDTRF